MTGFGPLFSSFPYVDFPHQLIGWFGLLMLAGILVWGILLSRRFEPSPSSRHLPGFVALLFLVFVGAIMGIRLPGVEALPLPNIPGQTGVPVVLPGASLAWVLAGGFLGPIPAVALGLLGGLLRSFWGTHSLFTIIEIGSLALVYSWLARQTYRGRIFNFLRRPLGAAAVVAAASIPYMMVSSFFAVNGELPVRFDFAFTQNWLAILTQASELLIAGLLVELVYLLRPQWWSRQPSLKPSPLETSMQARALAWTIPTFVMLLASLLIVNWIVAGHAARQMLTGRMSSTAQVAAEGLPYFLETGQSLIFSMATPDLVTMPEDELQDTLAAHLRSVPYFRQLFVFDRSGNPLGGYPINDALPQDIQVEEQSGLVFAQDGVPIQTYAIQPSHGSSAAQISLIASIKDAQGNVVGVMVGRTDLDSNPFTQPAIRSLNTISDLEGEAYILDEQGRVLYHSLPDSTLLMSDYSGQLPDEAGSFDEISTTGTRQMVYSQPVEGRAWSVVLSIPALVAQRIAFSNAGPPLILLVVAAIVLVLMLGFGLRSITAYLQTLSGQAALISQGHLDSPLAVVGEDEVGRLARAFELMRLALKTRLSELKRLLAVSQGVASNLEIGAALYPLLQAALDDEAVAARVVLIPEVRVEMQGNQRVAFGVGSHSDAFAHLDGQVFDLMRSETVVPIPNLARARRFTLPPGKPYPAAVVALALRSEAGYFGVLWVSFDTPRTFSEEQIRFLSTLASQAALAAATARSYATAEVGRQRLAAVLGSTPEPVLVFDEQGRLLLLNPAASQVQGLLASTATGVPMAESVIPLELKSLLSMPIKEGLISKEIPLPNHHIYFASASPVIAEGTPVGKVCILRDITHFKELDSLKSDFVNTVSHDLRSPLALVRGYATMLGMVGDMNDQQKSYIKKILDGVDHMTLLVGNLLDLGRIEAGIGLRLEKVNPQEIVDLVIHSLQPKATQKKIHLECENAGQPVDGVEADPVLLRQSIFNLVDNAIKFTSVNGKVKIRVQWKTDSVVFEVHDDGIGIAPLDLPRVFEKFYRSGQREAYAERGTGLGLAIVRSVVERHGGKVWPESQLGKGSSFYLEIPVHHNSK